MSELKLILAVKEADKNVAQWKKRCATLQKELDKLETILIEAKEAKIKAEDDLQRFRVDHVLENSIEEGKQAEIEAYRQRMPEMMERIKDEKPLRFASITDLDTMSSPTYVIR